MGFARDKQTGDTAEDYISSILEAAGIPTQRNDDRTKYSDYDLTGKLNKRPFTIESKYDLYESRSGNIAIEFFNPKSGRPTGIDATKADLWIHVLDKPMTVWATSVATLRRYIREHDPVKVVDCGGDANAAILLYKRQEIFKDIFHRLDGLKPIPLRTLLVKLLGPRWKLR